MNGQTCDVCNHVIENNKYMKIDLYKDYTSQGFSEKAIECCIGCIGTAIIQKFDIEPHSALPSSSELVIQAIGE